MSRDAVGTPPLSSNDDAQLMVALSGGDRRALATLYDRYAPLLMGVLVPMMGSRREAEDLVHDVFLEVWRHSADYDPERGSVRTWIAVRARSRALDRLRSVAHTRVDSLEALDAAGRAGLGESHAVEERPWAADRTRVRVALAALPEEQRVVLELAYFEGLSSQEIAARVAAPVGTVKSRVAAAMNKLRAALVPDGADA